MGSTKVNNAVPSSSEPSQYYNDPRQAIPDSKQSTSDDNMGADNISTTDTLVDFGEASSMPPMLNLQTAGLRRSPRIAALKIKPWYKCNLISKCFCVLSVAATLQWTPTLNGLYSSTKHLVFATVNSYHSANQLFDNTLNSLHPMVLVAEKQDNEAYTSKEMLRQPDAAEFIKAMMREANDHES